LKKVFLFAEDARSEALTYSQLRGFPNPREHEKVTTVRGKPLGRG